MQHLSRVGCSTLRHEYTYIIILEVATCCRRQEVNEWIFLICGRNKLRALLSIPKLFSRDTQVRDKEFWHARPTFPSRPITNITRLHVSFPTHACYADYLSPCCHTLHAPQDASSMSPRHTSSPHPIASSATSSLTSSVTPNDNSFSPCWWSVESPHVVCLS